MDLGAWQGEEGKGRDETGEAGTRQISKDLLVFRSPGDGGLYMILQDSWPPQVG